MKLGLQQTLAVAAVTACAGGIVTVAHAADQIRIVGSSTVYPFSSYVAEELGETTDFRTPVVESTGSGGGFKLFCAGDGADTPDISNASRRMKPSEFKRCQDNGVTDITENVIGSDGIVFAQSNKTDAINLTREQLTLAVAARVPKDGELVDNPYTTWRDIDDSLPDRDIMIYGPPTSSGTRDAFEELVMEHGSENIDGYDQAYTTIRQDGAYVPSGENDNLIVKKLARNTDAFGIFGYSYLEENRDKIQGAKIGDVAPERDLISSGDYPVSRSLFFYTKNAHIDRVDGMSAYVDMFLSERMIGDRGHLKRLGLIPLPKERLTRQRSEWQQRARLTAADLDNG